MIDKEKELAGSAVSDFITDGMILGLGTGSTFYYAIKKIGEMVKDGLKIKAVSTSSSTDRLAESLNIPLLSIDDVEKIDLTIDGADEVDPNFNGIKGGGGALLFEKVVKLGAFPLPIEVVPYALRDVFKKLEARGYNPKIRMKEGEKYLTDSGNHIIDAGFGVIEDAYKLEVELNMIPGVVENGLFLDVVDIVIVGKGDGVEVIRKE
jgi:ribose 5-phosphate isomerase A